MSIAVLAAVQAVGASGPAGSRGTPTKDGKTLFVVQCSSCHGVSGQGSRVAPPLIDVGGAAVDWYVATGRMPLSYPGEEPVRKQPAFDREQIKAIVAYVTSLSNGAGGARGPAIPKVSMQRADSVHGRKLFAQNCQSCHGSDGEGNSVGFGWVAPALYAATPTQVAEAIRFGPGIMPRFGERQLSQRDLDSLVGYIQTLRKPDDRGGTPLGHIGPVSEGLVGWIIGLGLLVGVIRFIGTRT
ncbi:MAG: c-type cytochrome [Candidatus Eremiobacteraeota bacterium]|nr:c-type cytochrome [Candidatus Eremiobacteraeota bacterium]